MSFSLTCALHTPLPPPPVWGFEEGVCGCVLPPQLEHTRVPRLYRLGSCCSNFLFFLPPPPPQVPVHLGPPQLPRPPRTSAQASCSPASMLGWSQRADLLKTPGSSENRDNLILYYFAECLCLCFVLSNRMLKRVWK